MGKWEKVRGDRGGREGGTEGRREEGGREGGRERGGGGREGGREEEEGGREGERRRRDGGKEEVREGGMYLKQPWFEGAVKQDVKAKDLKALALVQWRASRTAGLVGVYQMGVCQQHCLDDHILWAGERIATPTTTAT